MSTPKHDPTQEYYDAIDGPRSGARMAEPEPFECSACRRMMSETAEVCTSCARKLDGHYESTAPLCK